MLNGTRVGRIILEKLAEGDSSTKIASDTIEPSKMAESLSKLASCKIKTQGGAEAATAIMKFASDTISELVRKNEELEKAANVRVLIDTMVEKGVVDADGIEEKVAELLSKTSNELEVVKEATNMLIQSNSSTLFEKEAESLDPEVSKAMFEGHL
jgi:hypothetical protein